MTMVITIIIRIEIRLALSHNLRLQRKGFKRQRMPPRNEFTEGEMEVFMMTKLIMVTMMTIVVIGMRIMRILC